MCAGYVAVHTTTSEGSEGQKRTKSRLRCCLRWQAINSHALHSLHMPSCPVADGSDQSILAMTPDARDGRRALPIRSIALVSAA